MPSYRARFVETCVYEVDFYSDEHPDDFTSPGEWFRVMDDQVPDWVTTCLLEVEDRILLSCDELENDESD